VYGDVRGSEKDDTMTTEQLRLHALEAKERARNLISRTQHQAEAENRAFTPSEQATIDEALRLAEAAQTRYQHGVSDANFVAEVNRRTGGQATGGGSPTGLYTGRTLGAAFTQSDAFKWLKDTAQTRTGTWSSPSAELPLGVNLHAATITEDPTAGGLTVPPQYLPGILPYPTRPLVVRDLIAPGTTTSNQVVYQKEQAFTNAAATVAEGAAKPESAITFVAVTSAVRKIAHFVPISTELLEDVPGIASYIDARLGVGLNLTEEDQLLNGNGVSPNILGFLQLPGLAPDVPRGSDNNMDAVGKQIGAIASSVFEMPSGIIMHPSNWLTITMSKSAQGEYLGNGPLAAPQPRTLWGLPVAVTPAITAGTALVGAFRTASQIFDRGGMRMSASNSHENYFVLNLIALLCEKRLALCCYREAAFGRVTGLA
jgi:HK97 family phage major capsid protein